MNKRVVLSFADAMTAQLLAADLRRTSQFHIEQCVLDPAKISDSLAEHSPEILLLGTKTREGAFSALPLLRRIRSEFPGTRTIVFFEDSAHDLIAELFRAGAKGVFNRSEYDLKRLCRCISSVASGQIWANSEQLGSVLDVFAETASLNIVNANGDRMLTRRERDVVKLVAEGYSNREIAQQLRLSIHTVKNYLFNIFEKLGISSRAELVMYVLSNSDNAFSRMSDMAQVSAVSTVTLPVKKRGPTRELPSGCSNTSTQRVLAG